MLTIYYLQCRKPFPTKLMSLTTNTNWKPNPISGIFSVIRRKSILCQKSNSQRSNKLICQQKHNNNGKNDKWDTLPHGGHTGRIPKQKNHKRTNTITYLEGGATTPGNRHAAVTREWDQTPKLHKHKMDNRKHLHQRNKTGNNETNHNNSRLRTHKK